MQKIVGYTRNGQNFTPIYEEVPDIKPTNMEFNIIDHEQRESFGDAILPKAKQEEISKNLDELVQKYTTDAPTLVTVAQVIKDIASFCNTNEEFAYAIVLHMGWHQRRGFNIAPR